MHIPKSQLCKSDYERIVKDLYALIEQPLACMVPPCPNCPAPDSNKFKSIECNSGCTFAPSALSEDPERYPIEEHVVPLVFELTSMRLVQTCWSCEGHLDINGKLWKLPQVSFYSSRPIYPQLICNYLSSLHWKKKLAYPWDVVLSNYGRKWDVIYTIKCDMSRVESPDIHLMHKDLLSMANNLNVDIKNYARTVIDEVSAKVLPSLPH